MFGRFRFGAARFGSQATTATVTLAALSGTLSVKEHSANGTVVGTPTGYTSGSTKSLTVNAGGRFAIDGTTGQITVLDGTLLDYATNRSHSITVRETLAGASNSPKDTVMTVQVTSTRIATRFAFWL